MERIPGIGPGASPWQGDAFPLRHIRTEPPTGTDPVASSLPRMCSAIELRRRVPGFAPRRAPGTALPAGLLGRRDSNPDCRSQGPADCHYLTPHGAAPQDRTGPPAVQGRGRSHTRRRGVPGGARTHTSGVLSAVTPASWSTGTEPPPGADPGHPPYEGGAATVRGGKAAGQGFEPR